MFGNHSYLTAIVTAAALTSHVLGSLHLLCTCRHGPYVDDDVAFATVDLGNDFAAVASTTDEGEPCECHCRKHHVPVVSERVNVGPEWRVIDFAVLHTGDDSAFAATSLDMRRAERPQPHPPPQPLHLLLCALRI